MEPPQSICPGRCLSVSHIIPYTVEHDRDGPLIPTFVPRQPIVHADPPMLGEGAVPLTPMAPLASSDSSSELLSASFDRTTFFPSSPKKGRSGSVSSDPAFRIEEHDGGNRGLFNAIDSVRDRLSPILIGMGRQIDVPEHLRRELSDRMLAEHQCVPVFVDDQAYEGHYKMFCKQVLWPLFHYTMPDIFLLKNADKPWRDYVRVNRAFADVVIATYQPGDTIWVHDYHLMLLPQMLREALPQARIGFFLHVPFPSSELFRCLHVRSAILEGMLGADLIGFQTYSFARHFLQTTSRILGYETTPSSVRVHSASVAVGIFPIGIDINAFLKRRDTDEVQAILAQMRRFYSGMKVIVSRDKLDNIKGVPHKLLAFEEFLRVYPSWRGKVVMIQVATLSTSNRELELHIQELVTRINGTYGSLPYTPVIYHHQNLPFSHYAALLMLGDACLITPLRDGMNLTAHEFVSCQKETGCPLILSEFAGTYGSLGGALRVNPWDKRQVADSINEALLMSEMELKLKHAELFRYVTANSAQYWMESFLAELHKVTSHRRMSHRKLARSDLLAIVKEVGCAGDRLVVLDYDALFASSRTDWAPPPPLIAALRALAAQPRTSVLVMSGRSRKRVDTWFRNVPGIMLCAENGAFARTSGTEWSNQLLWIDQSWRERVTDTLEYYAERTTGSVVEENETFVAWDYCRADPRFAAWQAKELMAHLNDVIGTSYAVHVLDVAKRIEVRPAKVASSAGLRKLLGDHVVQVDCVLAIGLSDTHEELEAFVMSDAIDRLVGHEVKKLSCPLHDTRDNAVYLGGVSGVVDLLELLGEARQG